MFRKILIANRGEIAVRLLRACRDLGIVGVAVYSDIDRTSLHVLLADEAYRLGPAPASESYLRIDRIIDVARRCGAEAIHPGYGFLAENPALAAACADAGIVFIGPTAAAMEALGSKTAARQLAKLHNLPILPGTVDAVRTLEEARTVAEQIGYPVMLKAAAGGGGKGMRLVTAPADLQTAFELAGAEALASFGNAAVFLERAVVRPRHVEIQILGDQVGNIVWLGERECSIQRRHQKIIEESPAPHLSDATRNAMGAAATAIARAAGYTNAGTVEFLVDDQDKFYFLEVNTRLQVEHPVTELVTGLDLVQEQIRIAMGSPLRFSQEQIVRRGHAIECRICAEDPANGFMPSPGLIRRVIAPGGPGLREDSGVYSGWAVPNEYDPLLSKLIAWGETRGQAAARMRRALFEYQLDGVRNNLGFLRQVFSDSVFLEGHLDTGYVARLMAGPAKDDLPDADVAALGRPGSVAGRGIGIGEPSCKLRRTICLAAHGAKRGLARRTQVIWSVHIAGREYTVEWRRQDGRQNGGWTALRDREPVVMDVAVVAPGTISILLDGHSHTLYWGRTGRGGGGSAIWLGFSGRECEAGIRDPRRLSSQRRFEHEGRARLIAPMSGKVVKALVATGDEVAAGQGILVLEAMKMQNEVRSPKAGKLLALAVAPGTTVSTGDLLAEIE